MTINILRQYLDLCKKLNIEPTLKGANRFKSNVTVFDYLTELGFDRLIVDILG